MKKTKFWWLPLAAFLMFCAAIFWSAHAEGENPMFFVFRILIPDVDELAVEGEGSFLFNGVPVTRTLNLVDKGLQVGGPLTGTVRITDGWALADFEVLTVAPGGTYQDPEIGITITANPADWGTLGIVEYPPTVADRKVISVVGWAYGAQTPEEGVLFWDFDDAEWVQGPLWAFYTILSVELPAPDPTPTPPPTFTPTPPPGPDPTPPPDPTPTPGPTPSHVLHLPLVIGPPPQCFSNLPQGLEVHWRLSFETSAGCSIPTPAGATTENNVLFNWVLEGTPQGHWYAPGDPAFEDPFIRAASGPYGLGLVVLCYEDCPAGFERIYAVRGWQYNFDLKEGVHASSWSVSTKGWQTPIQWEEYTLVGVTR